MSCFVLSRALEGTRIGSAEGRAGRGTTGEARQDKSAYARGIQPIGMACLFVRMAGGRYYETGISPRISRAIRMHGALRLLGRRR
ncbi:hypothetical protein SAMN04487974_1176 [Pelagibacterium luteolum]|uniref:Uncharacterized protein n=1 Tax=Pelagibacterium luteolum TaxID=440168 RepID=A0A1G7Z1C4_9HYPH|nr:hypothetical protein SAMN04487974_1176 [Pelagibacterium luteolum]